MKDQIEHELDQAHELARKAYQARDLEAYMFRFSPGLKYQQVDGKVIGREQLSRDVAAQFRKLTASTSAYRRERLRAVTGGVEEELFQEAWICATAFGFLHRIWHLERCGTYSWQKADNRWQIIAVRVISERLTNSRWRVGRRPKLPGETLTADGR